MNVINQSAEWFKSDAAEKQYNSYETLADKTVFLYSYLRKIADKSFEKENILFKIAFLLADEIGSAGLPYSNYSALISTDNPFVSYLKNSKTYISQESAFIAMCSILHNKVDVNDTSAFIYDEAFFDDEDYLKNLDELGCCFVSNPTYFVNDPAKFEIKEKLKKVQLEIYWLFGQSDECEED